MRQRDRVDYVGFPLADKFLSAGTGAKRAMACTQSPSHYIIGLIAYRCIRGDRSNFCSGGDRVLTRRYEAGEITNWPYAEAFIPTEMQNNGFVVRKLGEFGKVDKYDWWPPTHEKDLPSLQDQAFLHPVLDERKYVASCLQWSDLRSYFYPDGELRRLLDRSSPLSSIPALLMEFIRRLPRLASARRADLGPRSPDDALS